MSGLSPKPAIVGVGDMLTTADPQAEIVTYALGSCLGVTVYDPAIHVGGMLHFMLPLSDCSPDRAKKNPLVFADTGLPLLFRAIYSLGGVKGRLVVKVAGGSSVSDENQFFKIGSRNLDALQKIFYQNKISISAQDVGGPQYRTLRFRLLDGRVTVITSDGSKEL